VVQAEAVGRRRQVQAGEQPAAGDLGGSVEGVADGDDAVGRGGTPSCTRRFRWPTRPNASGGEAAGAVVALLRVVQGRRAYQQGDAAPARALLVRAVALAERAALPTSLVLALASLADAELGCGDRAAARAALVRARELVDDEPPTPFAERVLAEAEQRIGRVASRSAVRAGGLGEQLTDRELSILRALPGSATQREIGAALFLSVNTVKAYNKSLYRKLGVTSRMRPSARRAGSGSSDFPPRVVREPG
jgi:DNA-binding NarL/FixJ family response regulator